jgi:hypothetical protein
MAASAFIHSKLSKVKLDTSGGVLTEISDSCDECEMPEDLELSETTTFTVTSKTYLVGFADGKISLGGPWNRTLHTQLKNLKEAFRDGTLSSASFEYGPEGTDSGDIKITCEVVMTSYKKSSSVKDPVRWSAELQITGAVTETTY